MDPRMYKRKPGPSHSVEAVRKESQSAMKSMIEAAIADPRKVKNQVIAYTAAEKRRIDDGNIKPGSERHPGTDQAHLNQNPWIICYDCATQHEDCGQMRDTAAETSFWLEIPAREKQGWWRRRGAIPRLFGVPRSLSPTRQQTQGLRLLILLVDVVPDGLAYFDHPVARDWIPSRAFDPIDTVACLRHGVRLGHRAVGLPCPPSPDGSEDSADSGDLFDDSCLLRRLWHHATSAIVA